MLNKFYDRSICRHSIPIRIRLHERTMMTQGVNKPPIRASCPNLRGTGKCLLTLTLDIANQAFFMPTCPGQQLKIPTWHKQAEV